MPVTVAIKLINQSLLSKNSEEKSLSRFLAEHPPPLVIKGNRKMNQFINVYPFCTPGRDPGKLSGSPEGPSCPLKYHLQLRTKDHVWDGSQLWQEEHRKEGEAPLQADTALRSVNITHKDVTSTRFSEPFLENNQL